jgi:hypothetical protein
VKNEKSVVEASLDNQCCYKVRVSFDRCECFILPGTEKSAHLLCFLEGFSSKEKQAYYREKRTKGNIDRLHSTVLALDYEFLGASLGGFLQ